MCCAVPSFPPPSCNFSIIPVGFRIIAFVVCVRFVQPAAHSVIFSSSSSSSTSSVFFDAWWLISCYHARSSGGKHKNLQKLKVPWTEHEYWIFLMEEKRHAKPHTLSRHWFWLRTLRSASSKEFASDSGPDSWTSWRTPLWSEKQDRGKKSESCLMDEK